MESSSKTHEFEEDGVSDYELSNMIILGLLKEKREKQEKLDFNALPKPRILEPNDVFPSNINPKALIRCSVSKKIHPELEIFVAAEATRYYRNFPERREK